MIFPLDFFEYFKKKTKEQLDPHQAKIDLTQKPPLYAFEQHRKTADQEFAEKILKNYQAPLPPPIKRPEEP